MHIDIHKHATQDINQLWIDDPEAAAEVQVVLEQLEADPNAIDKLTTYGNNLIGQNNINVKPWEGARKKGDLWRFRILDTPATVYRVIYGYHWQTRQLCVFAVVHKDKFDYEDFNSSTNKRIFDDWQSL